jgi:predicted transposase/invertase (TIGR01784 family)
LPVPTGPKSPDAIQQPFCHEEKGMEKGIERGRMEERQRLAIELLKENFTDEQVADLTKLSTEEILKLKEQL